MQVFYKSDIKFTIFKSRKMINFLILKYLLNKVLSKIT